jgi:hypothetical protein
MSNQDQQVVKWYTLARKFPQLIGRTHDGTRLPGGPYTVTQIVAGGAVLFVASKTSSLWANFGLMGNIAVLLGVTWGVVVALGKIPLGARNPLAILAGGWHAVTAPRTGRIGGRPLRLRPPHQVRHRIAVMVPGPDQPAPAPAPASSPAPAPAPAPATAPIPAPTPQRAPQEPATSTPPRAPAQPAGPALTGLQSLLAQPIPSHRPEPARRR